MKTILIFLTVLLSGTVKPVNYTKVSWYGPGFHGKKTASGETYDMYKYTCASPFLKFGTRILITNISNKDSLSVIVRVNDRGPYKNYVVRDSVTHKFKVIPYMPLEAHPIRAFDLSKGAFDKIADLKEGVIRVKYTKL